MSREDDGETHSVTSNPTECPACGSVGTEYNHGTQEFKCPDRTCGVNWFYRGETFTRQPPDPPNYDRGADGRTDILK